MNHTRDKVQKLKQEILEEIKIRQINNEELASKLDLLPIGVEVLLVREWTVEVAIHVAKAMGLDVDFKVRRI